MGHPIARRDPFRGAAPLVDVDAVDVDAANAVPVVGQPLAYGIGFGMLLFVVFTDSWARSLVTVVHEGGHIVVGTITLRGPRGFELVDGGGGGTPLTRSHWSISDLLTRIAGYPFPPLVGYGGALLVRDGHVASVLWISVLLLLTSFFEAANALAIVVTAIALIATGWVALDGGPQVQAAVAVGLVWWMLIGGAYWGGSGLFSGGTGDATDLARRTLIPRIVWDLAFTVVGIVLLWKGGRALLAL